MERERAQDLGEFDGSDGARVGLVRRLEGGLRETYPVQARRRWAFLSWR